MRSTLLCLDVTQGRERVIVPVFNEVDDATNYVPEGFTYVRTSSERISAAAVAVLDSKDHPPAGPTERAHMGEGTEDSLPAYNEEYCLVFTSEDGIVEPPPEGSSGDEDKDRGPVAAMGLLGAVERSGKREGGGGGGTTGPGVEDTTAGITSAKAGGAAGAGGSGAGASALASSSSGAVGHGGVKPKKPECFLQGPMGACVQLGMWLPLEVFRTVDKGWGLRCAIEIPAGAFVCEYAGEVLTDAETEATRGDDDYLFDLDHFELLSESRNDNDDGNNGNTNQNGGGAGGGGSGEGLEKEMSDDMSLCVSARMFGSVARFINHHPQGNLVIQTVFTPGIPGCRADNQKLYRIAFFASRDIEPMEELSYSYGTEYWNNIDKNMVDVGGQEAEEEDSDVAP